MHFTSEKNAGQYTHFQSDVHFMQAVTHTYCTLLTTLVHAFTVFNVHEVV